MKKKRKKNSDETDFWVFWVSLMGALVMYFNIPVIIYYNGEYII